MSSRSTWRRWLTIGLWLSLGAAAATFWLVATGLVQLGSGSKSAFEDIASTLPSVMPPAPNESAIPDDPLDDADLFGGPALESAAPESPAPRNYADRSEGEIRPGQALPAPPVGWSAPTLGSPARSMESPPVTIGSAAAGSAAPKSTPKPPPTASASAAPAAPAAPPEPVDLLAEVDRKLAALELGHIAFNTPDAIPLGDAATIELLLSLEETANELSRAIRGSGPVETARVQISDQVEARLTGLGFRIEAVTPERQAVSRAERTRWQWQIEPTKPDRLALHLTLSAVIKIDGIPSTRSIRTFEKTIYVEVPLSRRVADMLAGNLELISTLVLIPIVGGVWRHYRRRKRRLAQAADANPTRRAA